MYEDYGNLAGFAGFAGAADTSDVPVVRYQDLHRSHAPASAGAMAVYDNPATARQGDFEENLDGYGDVAYGDVAYGEAHGAPPEFAGIQPLPIPTHVAAYGRSHGYGAYPSPKASPTAADLGSYPMLSKGKKSGEYYTRPSDDVAAYVMVLQSRLISKRHLSAKDSAGKTNVDGIFGDATETAVKNFQRSVKLTADGIVDGPTWFALYDVSTSPAAEESAVGAFYRALQASAGLQTGREDKQTVAAAPASTGTEIDWKKVALWSGVAVGGVLLTVVIVKAVKS